MKVEDKNGQLIITIDKRTELLPSASGKTLIVASTNGNQPAGINVHGSPLIIGLNAYVKAPNAPAGNGGGKGSK